LTGIVDRPRGWAAQVLRRVGSASRVGASFYRNSAGRTQGGLHGVIGISTELYALADLGRVQSPGVSTRWVETLRLGWEAARGLQLGVLHELSGSSLEAYGLSLNYFPRVHWEFAGELRRQQSSASSGLDDTIGWLLLHYYL